MDQRSKSSMATTVSKFSSLLIKENIINLDQDESALNEALQSAGQNLSSSSFSQTSQMSSMDFIKGPLSTILCKHEKTKLKIEGLRKEKYLAEVSQLKSKPTIDKNSKSLVKHMPPLHLRTEKILKDKEKKLEQERTSRQKKEETDFNQTCTFRPSSRGSSRSRSPTSVTDELYRWEERKNKGLERKRKEKEEKETVQDKPVIDGFSQKLSKMVSFKQRCITPVHERLSRVAKKEVKKTEFSFKPQIVPKSKEIVARSRENTPNASMADSRTSSRNKSRPGSKNGSRENSKEKIYKINTCLGVIDKQNYYVNELRVNEKNKEFITKLNKIRYG